MVKVFIVGSAGTTGLKLHSRLSSRSDIELLEIDESLRKDENEIQRLVALSDFAFLCLPDEAARETAKMSAGTDTKIIDTSTAHRTLDGWAYGFPELSPKHVSDIRTAKCVASPGCHASGFISLVYPLISSGILSPDSLLSCVSLTGYSGGGKKMIADYENTARGTQLDSPMQYAMRQSHKHLPEIIKQCGLKASPVFMPIVGDFYSGMLVTVPLHASMLNGKYSPHDIREAYKAHYGKSKLIRVTEDEPASLFANTLSGRDDMEIFVSGSEDKILLCSLFDNLGKGASGAAIECFNLMCGLPEETGLILS
jgi:N-acetyl-gamma-glutamyl-phosphate reductase